MFISIFYKSIGASYADIQDNTSTPAHFTFDFYQDRCYLMRTEYILNKFTESERTCFAFGSM